MAGPLFSVVVPATTANLGPGYDSIGLALSLYMTVEVSESEEWKVCYIGDEYASLPRDESNLIVQTIIKVAAQYGKVISPHALRIVSDIPLGKGLGSSATAIAAGIEIADKLLGLSMSPNEKVRFGSQFEGHSDNVAAAILGGAVITYYVDNELYYLQLPNPAIGAVLLVPPHALKTTESRRLLPNELSHAVAVAGSAASSLLSAALAIGDWKLAGQMMERDRFHEPYRKELLPEFDRVREVCQQLGAYGMTISGAGPSIFVAVEKGKEQEMAAELEKKFPFYGALAVSTAPKGTFVQ
ncbi:homoserine kinase [Sporosarcina sp. Te-1]|uniref:homoserine kinase n=1 Tax=Sporosarcina sp. Te-1 TaxID=2818390 RepID=UPI001A9CDB0D|nr:homoserine kinase [Sporosarcina sp. Te-1]QTD40198.1 homoserine kinase [Sporosarcina sp. Te-1]